MVDPTLMMRQCANALRMLSVDAVERANSGHPGMPLGMADIATVLWQRYLRHDPKDPQWLNRDRFILSNGHGSMLLYALLHLTGYGVTIDDLKGFRQLHSRTPGHPEYGLTPGVETTTGPLGQGIANAVGMALAEQLLARQYNTDRHNVIDHRTWVFLGDGCLMEGVAHESCSLAATWRLGKLIAFWDANGISIDGDISGWQTEDVAARFRAYGWHVINDINGHDYEAIDAAIHAALRRDDMPSLLCCRTTIGYGAPHVAGTAAAHGSPLGADETSLLREALGWPHHPFVIPDDIYTAWRNIDTTPAQTWHTTFEHYQQQQPQTAAALLAQLRGELSFTSLDAHIHSLNEDTVAVATRKASFAVLNTIKPTIPALIGGSADLTGSNLTAHTGARNITNDGGDYIYFGVREFGMAAILNGMQLHGGFRVFGGTFLVFSDYMRNAMRLAALMKQPVIYVLTHDSIGLGEDGPTHQPIEQLESLRMIPNMHVWRPADAWETAIAWRAALQRTDGPTVLALSRQNLPSLANERRVAVDDIISHGAYLLREGNDVALVATGSEVQLALQAADLLGKKGITARVISMPCREALLRLPATVRASLLPDSIPVVAVEAGIAGGWWQLADTFVGMTSFGESAPGPVLFNHFNITAAAVCTAALSVVA